MAKRSEKKAKVKAKEWNGKGNFAFSSHNHYEITSDINCEACIFIMWSDLYKYFIKSFAFALPHHTFRHGGFAFRVLRVLLSCLAAFRISSRVSDEKAMNSRYDSFLMTFY